MKAMVLAFFGVISLAAMGAQKVTIHGVETMAEVDSVYANGTPVSGSLTEEPVQIPFANGNLVSVTGFFWLSVEGRVTLLTSPGDIMWKRANGDVIPLNCKKHEEFKNRVVSFDSDSGVYKMGCHLSESTDIEINGGYVKVLAQSALDLNGNGTIAFIATTASDQVVNLPFKERLKIRNNSSLGFYENGNPRFVAIRNGEIIEIQTIDGHRLVVTTPSGISAYTYFYENGMVKKALLGKAFSIKVQDVCLTIPMGDPIGVHENGQIGLFRVLTGGKKMVIKDPSGNDFELIDETLMCLDESGELVDPKVCEDKFMK